MKDEYPKEIREILSKFRDRCHDFVFICVMDDTEYSEWSNNSYAEGAMTKELRNLSFVDDEFEPIEEDEDDDDLV